MAAIQPHATGGSQFLISIAMQQIKYSDHEVFLIFSIKLVKPQMSL